MLSKEMAQHNSAIGISINEEELFNLKLLLDLAMGSYNYLTTITVKVRSGDRILTGDKDIQEVTEQLLVSLFLSKHIGSELINERLSTPVPICFQEGAKVSNHNTLPLKLSL